MLYVIRTLFMVFLISGVIESAVAQDDRPLYVSVITVTVKPEAITTFEKDAGKVITAFNVVDAAQSVYGYQIGRGGKGFSYVFAIPFRAFGELDAWAQLPVALTTAYGEDEGRSLLKSFLGAMATSESVVYRTLPDLSNFSDNTGPPAKFILVISAEVKPTQTTAYEMYLGKIKQAVVKAEGMPAMTRRVSMFGEGLEYVTTIPFVTHGEIDAWLKLNPLKEAYGETEARHIGEMMNASITRMKAYTLIYRPDLSRLAN